MDENEVICLGRMKLDFTTEMYVPDSNDFYLYDIKGILISTKQDLCDCSDEECPGCFTPCDECKSNKCGHMCRVHRTWRYGKIEVNDGAVEMDIDEVEEEMEEK